MSGVTQLAYLGFEVADLGAWEDFARRLLGHQVIERDGGLELRYDERAYRILLRPGPADDLVFLGWEVADAASLDALVARLGDQGIASHQDRSLADSRRVRRLVALEDPAGVATELVLGCASENGRFVSPKVREGFITGDQGLGHLALDSRSREESERFYRELLGFRLSDRIIADLDGFKVDIAFLRVNSRHHSLALGGALGRRLHHFMLQFASLDDLGRTYDRATKAGVVATTLGRHSNDRMVSFYANTPSGFQVELGWGGIQVQDSGWREATYDHIAVWGHRPAPAPTGKG